MRKTIVFVFALSLALPVLSPGTEAWAGEKFWTGTVDNIIMDLIII